MDDDRIWAFEERLWHGGRETYEAQVSEHVLMALPAEPWLFDGRQAIDAVSNTPRWDKVEFSDKRVSRPEEGLIVIAYRVKASRPDDAAEDKSYEALCTSVLRRLSHEDWRVVQHQQTPIGVMVAEKE